MTFQQYPGQQFPGQQFPGQSFPGQGFQLAPPRLGLGVVGVITAVLGILIGGVALSMPITIMVSLPSGASVGDLRGGAITSLCLYAFAGLLMIAGSATSFARPVAGLIVLVIGSVVATALPLLEAVLYGVRYGRFMKASFEFELESSYATVLCLSLAPIILILCVVTMVIRGPRRRRQAARAAMPAGGYPPAFPPQQSQPYPQQYPPPQQGGPPPRQW